MSGKLKRIGKLSSDDLVLSSEIAEAFDLQLTKKLFSALTDSEFGGHGMIEPSFDIVCDQTCNLHDGAAE
jgi:hypothetical protein